METIKNGSLRVSLMRNFEWTYKNVNSVDEAKKIIREAIKDDLKDNSITDNSFDLEIYEDNGDGFDWYTWYNNETGNDIDQEIEEENNG